jgi:hypothetical protein
LLVLRGKADIRWLKEEGELWQRPWLREELI